MYLFLINLLRIVCFDYLDILESVLRYFSVWYWSQFVLRVYILIVVMFHLLPERLLCFVVFLQLYFVSVIRVVSSVWLVKQEFCLLYKLYVGLGISLE